MAPMATDIESKVPALGKTKLGDLTDEDLASILDEAIERALPETPAVPVAAFNSAI